MDHDCELLFEQVVRPKRIDERGPMSELLAKKEAEQAKQTCADYRDALQPQAPDSAPVTTTPVGETAPRCPACSVNRDAPGAGKGSAYRLWACRALGAHRQLTDLFQTAALPSQRIMRGGLQLMPAAVLAGLLSGLAPRRPPG